MTWFTVLALMACKDKDAGKDVAGDDTELVDWCTETDDTLPEGYSDEWVIAPKLPAGDISQFGEADGIVWAGSVLSGVYASEDRGEFWQSRLRNNRTHVYGQMAVHKDNPDIAAHPADSIWYTVNGGDSWDEFDLQDVQGPERIFRGLVFRGDDFFAITESGDVWKSEVSTAGFGEFAKIGNAPINENPPHTTNDIQRTIWMASNDRYLYAYQRDFGVYRSADGVDWDLIKNDMHYPNTLVVWDDELWIGSNESNTLAAWKSDDDGDSWTQLFTTPVDHTITAMTPTPNGSVIATTDENVFRWDGSAVTDTAPEDGHYFLTVFQESQGRLMIGHSLGIHLSDDDGLTWRASDAGLEDNDAASVASVEGCDNTVFIGTRCRSGLFLSTDYGESTERVDEYFHYVMVLEPAPNHMRHVWATSDEAILHSDDFGATWTASRVSEDQEGFGYHVHGLGVHPEDPCTALVGSVGSGIWTDTGGGQVYKTTDCGESWDVSSDGIPYNEYSVHAFEYIDDNPEVVLMGTFRGGDILHDGPPAMGMYRSTDGGGSWSEVALDIQDVAMFDECEGTVYAATDGGLLMSTDDGESWTVGVEPGPNQEFVAVACQGSQAMAIDTQQLISRTTDAGATWVDFSEGLPTIEGGQQATYGQAMEISSDGKVAWTTPGTHGLYMRVLE